MGVGVIISRLPLCIPTPTHISKALHVMKTGIESLECYYSSTHKMFVSLNFLYGYYLIQNEKSSEAIVCLKKALTTPYFSEDKDFLGMVYTLLIMASIQSSNIDLAENYCLNARPYISSTNFTALNFYSARSNTGIKDDC